jgi:hypothetical protein
VLTHSFPGRSLTVERNKSLRSRSVARAMIPVAPFVAKVAGSSVYSIGESSDPVRPTRVARQFHIIEPFESIKHKNEED